MSSPPVKEVVVEKPAPAANNVVVEQAAAPAADKVVVEKAAPNATVVEKPAAVVATAPAVVVAPPMTMNTNPPIVDKFVALPGTSQPAVVAVAPVTGAVVSPATTTVVVDEKRPVMTSHPKCKRSWFKEHLIAYLGELIGTFMFLTLAFAGTQIALQQNTATGNEPPSLGILAYIALVFGFSLTVTAWIFYRVTGGMFNPAVTLGLMLIGALSWSRALVVFWAQMFGALLAGGFVDLLLPGPLTVVTHVDEKFGSLRAVFLEAFLTFMLIMTIFFLAVEKHRGTFLAPLAIGLTLFVAELVGVRYTGGSLNPARSFGAQVWAMRGACDECGDDAGKWGSHWVYWFGPLIGALAAVFFYRILKALEYEIYGDVGQDADRPLPADDDDDDDVVIDPTPGTNAATATTSNRPVAQPLPRGMV
nr:hypothetical protein B0A51_06561 [Rachicladosporium sp. CCFEE 5018]